MPSGTWSETFAPILMTLITLCLLLLGFYSTARAQFSPGPISRAHRSLTGSLQCFQCHGLSGEEAMDDQCLSCHGAIRWLVDRERGLHGRIDRSKCAGCHPEHAGEEFDLVDRTILDRGVFDHREAGWPLRGKHAEAACGDCHKYEFQVSPALALRKTESSSHLWIGLEPLCASCHKDPHEGRLGTACADCHFETNFHDVIAEKFDHNRTRYLLRGRHRKVACADCHDPKVAWGRYPPHDACTACHKESHGGHATLAGKKVDCSECHGEDGFRPSTFTVAMHQTSAFPLEGKHRQVACNACHVKNPAGYPPASLGNAAVLLRPKFARCTDCHEEAHGRQLAGRRNRDNCKACHELNGWKPSSFTAEDHGKLRFPLDGRHAEVACAACHGPKRRKGLPSLPGPEVLGKAGVALRLGEVTCLSCHLDPHGARYAAVDTEPPRRKCISCHDFQTFSPTTIDVERHRKFDFPLAGAHRAVACVACHKGLERGPAKSSMLLPGWRGNALEFAQTHERCRDCHQDPHGEQFQAACSRCHDAEAFRPANRFDHNRDAAFPLQGAHAKVACAQCHPSRQDPEGMVRVIYQPLPHECQACHGEAELKPLGLAPPSPGREEPVPVAGMGGLDR